MNGLPLGSNYKLEWLMSPQVSDDFSGVTLNWLLQNAIVGQPRTGKTKQFVFLTNKYAIKGPYANPSTRINNLIERSRILSTWGVSHIVLPLGIFKSSDNRYFAIYPNFVTTPDVKTYAYTEKKHMGGYSYRVIQRTSVIKANAALKEERHRTWFYGKYGKTVLLDLVKLYLLGVGDVNLVNTLLDIVKGRVYLIDIDDNLTRKPQKDLDNWNEMFYFNKNPSAQVI